MFSVRIRTPAKGTGRLFAQDLRRWLDTGLPNLKENVHVDSRAYQGRRVGTGHAI